MLKSVSQTGPISFRLKKLFSFSSMSNSNSKEKQISATASILSLFCTRCLSFNAFVFDLALIFVFHLFCLFFSLAIFQLLFWPMCIVRYFTRPSFCLSLQPWVVPIYLSHTTTFRMWSFSLNRLLIRFSFSWLRIDFLPHLCLSASFIYKVSL